MAAFEFKDDVLKFKGKSQIYLETGTYLGNSVASASELDFKKLHSIELKPEFCQKATERFKDNERVTIHCGSSKEILPQLLHDINDPFFIYLDAHWSGPEYAGEMMDVYLPREIQALMPHKEKFKQGVILIDDMNFYIHNQEWCNGIEKLLKELNSDYKVEIAPALVNPGILRMVAY